MQPIPLPVYVAFLVCLLIGALSLGSAIESLLKFGVSGGDGLVRLLWAMAPFGVGYGLRRGSWIARWLVDLCAGLILVPAVALLPWMLFGWEDWEVNLPGAALGVLAIGSAIYLLRGLHTQAANDWFDKRRRASEPYRFGIRSILLATTVLAIALSGVQWSDASYGPREIESHTGATNGGAVFSYTYGTRKDRTDASRRLVDFVVIQRSTSGSLNSRVTTRWSSDDIDHTGTVELPNSDVLSLPGAVNLIEIHGDDYKTSTQNVTWPQLKGYMNSKPEIPSIAELLAFKPEAEAEDE
ncbi:hypothetical protein Pla123a_46740 [Posidoniimonas polymericola]|uniref:Uncharacterized protein n=1 Tax=Posidoniimonas polymericola TaxID=2528002 RepID=A0A5C5XTM4_9BACT|nr:hypothetical protein [Posidoniimonas polymericola]TWT66280.1 hypothetical protein Pla123a_46740 [Posidoniimonas polymericola]